MKHHFIHHWGSYVGERLRNHFLHHLIQCMHHVDVLAAHDLLVVGANRCTEKCAKTRWGTPREKQQRGEAVYFIN